MVLGAYAETSLADARQKREEARKLVAADIDSREHKRAVKSRRKRQLPLNQLPESGMQQIKNGQKNTVGEC